MKYIEFLNSARKHQYTCSELLVSIKQLNLIKPLDKAKHRSFLLNLYYLSGYIIECSIKYGIYHLISYDKNKCVKELNQDGISFNKNIKHHRFLMYCDIFNTRQPGLVLVDNIIDIDSDVIFIYREWDAQVRYWCKDINESIGNKINERNVEIFFKLATEVFNNVRSI